MRQYHDLMRHVLEHGVDKDDRTGTGTRSVFGYQMRFNLSQGFPLLTTKKLHYKSIIHELLWFLSGERKVDYLRTEGISIWEPWCPETGDLGPIYGVQWRKLTAEDGEPIDQIANIIETIKVKPDLRRLVVSAWNVEPARPDGSSPMPLPIPVLCGERRNCRASSTRGGRHLYRRPFNIASYALPDPMIAHVTGSEPGEFVHSLATRISTGPSGSGRDQLKANHCRFRVWRSIATSRNRSTSSLRRLRSCRATTPIRTSRPKLPCKTERPKCRPIVALVVARGENGAIGIGGSLPWRLSTRSAPVPQSHARQARDHGTAHLSVAAPILDQRVNIVLTRDRCLCGGWRCGGEQPRGGARAGAPRRQGGRRR